MIKDYREIREVVMQYVNGCAAGDVELAKKAFHKDAVMYGYLSFTDFHSLVKIDGRWTIVAKVFHQ